MWRSKGMDFPPADSAQRSSLLRQITSEVSSLWFGTNEIDTAPLQDVEGDEQLVELGSELGLGRWGR